MFKKTYVVTMLISLFAAALLTGCQKKEEEKGKEGAPGAKTPGTEAVKAAAGPKSFWAQKPGPNPRFYEVEQKLDTGGDFYLYQNAEGCVKEALDQVRELIVGAQIGDKETSAALALLDAARKSGLQSVQGMGMSAVRKGELYRTKMFLQGAKTNEGVFKVLGGAPHVPDALAYASSGTLLFRYADLNPREGFAFIRDAVKQVSPDEGAVEWDKAMAEAKAKLGTDVETVLSTLGPEFALVATLDPQVKIETPTRVSIPAPRFALLVQAKDSTLFDVLVKSIQEKKEVEATVEEQGGVRKCRLHVPPNPMFPVSPVLAFDGRYFFFALHETYLDELLAAKKSGGGLASQQEFKDLMKELPRECNGMLFIAKGFGDTLKTLVDEAVGKSGAPVKPEALMRFLVPGLSGMAMVRVNLPDGIWIVCNQAGQDAGSLVSSSAACAVFLSGGGVVFVVPVLAAIAVPNFLEAQVRSKVARTHSDMRLLATAIEAYMVDANLYVACATGEKSANAHCGADKASFGVSSFRIWTTPGERFMQLTTPVAFLTALPTDPFADSKGAVFGYWNDREMGWILFSAGPDQQYEIDPAKDYDATKDNPLPQLFLKTYDPTNGTTSRGDIWRVKQ